MRMWMVDPKIMCRKHLLGEHVETHMFLGSMKRNKNLSGFIDTNLFEIGSLIERHSILAKEMESRKYNHKSELDVNEYKKFCKNYKNVKVDSDASLKDLIQRCPECRQRSSEL